MCLIEFKYFNYEDLPGYETNTELQMKMWKLSLRWCNYEAILQITIKIN